MFLNQSNNLTNLIENQDILSASSNLPCTMDNTTNNIFYEYPIDPLAQYLSNTFISPFNWMDLNLNDNTNPKPCESNSLLNLYSEIDTKSSDTPFYSPPSNLLSSFDTMYANQITKSLEDNKSRIKKAKTKQQKLESNRLAAQKCRIKKKQWIKEREEMIKKYTTENTELEKSITSIKEDILNLKMLLASHKDCNLTENS